MVYPGHIVVFDLESGGFFPNQHLLCQIGIIVLDPNLDEVERYASYVNPSYNSKLIITPEAQKVHGLTIDFLKKNGKDLREVMDDVSTLFKKYKRSYYMPTACGHNVGFDLYFLEAIFNLFLSPHKGTLQSALYQFINKVPIDTMELARRKWTNNEVADFKLGTCAAHIGVENTKAHDAMGDIEVTAELLRYFLGCMKSEGGNFEQRKRSALTFQF
jgi:DNA polymerase III epsilon subunit-like protein